jgi:putative MATE family efflux protein
MLGEESIGKLLARLSIPAMVGMLVNALYNLVDTIFIGQWVGALAIGGLAIAFPLQMLTMALGMMLGVGAASVISRSLGAGNREKARSAAGIALSLSIVLGLLLMAVGHLFIDPILVAFGATDTLLPFAREYMFYILFGSAFTTTAMAGNNLIRSEGRATTAMVVMVIGTGMNIILDPVFILVLDMGIRGAAIATVISRFLSFAFVLLYFARGKSSLTLRWHHLVPTTSVMREISVLGLAVFVRQFGMSFLMVLVNNSLKYYSGDIAIAAFGAIFRLLAFIVLPIFGLGQGFQPIAGYNYGAKNFARVKEVLIRTMVISTILAAVAFGLIIGAPRFFISLFSREAGLISVAVPALRTIVLILPLLGVQVVGSIYFLAVGKALPALLLGLSRQVLFLVPLVLILPLFLGEAGIWTAFPVADGISALVTAVWLVVEMRREGMFHKPEVV